MASDLEEIQKEIDELRDDIEEIRSGARNTDRERIFESTYPELKFTIGNQLEAYRRVNQWSIDLAKIDLLGVSAILVGPSVTDLRITLLLVATVLSLVYALWCFIRILSPRKFNRGIGDEAVNEIDHAAYNGRSIEDHYRTVMYSYSDSVEEFTNKHDSVVEVFSNGVWASMTALLFLVIYAASLQLPNYPVAYEIPLLVIIPVIGLWGKDMELRDNS